MWTLKTPDGKTRNCVGSIKENLTIAETRYLFFIEGIGVGVGYKPRPGSVIIAKENNG